MEPERTRPEWLAKLFDGMGYLMTALGAFGCLALILWVYYYGI